jgi:hypothetical protein
MRKLIIAGMAVAMLAAIPSAASADVQRCEASVPVNTVIKTATFTMIQPANEYRQWSNVWTHDFTVTVNPEDNTFAGIGHQSGSDSNGPYEADWTVTGKFTDNNTKVNLVATRGDGLVITLNNETMGDDFATTAMPVTFGGNPLILPDGEVIEEKVLNLDIKTSTTTTPGTESVKNHGQFVKAQGGGKTAAQACAGMPLNSTQGSSILN